MTATTNKLKVWLAAGLNFFFMGAGTLYLGHRSPGSCAHS